MKRGQAFAGKTPLAAFLLALALIAGAVLAHGLQRKPRLSATNTRVIASKIAIVLAPDERRCQGGEYVPASASTVRLYVGFSGPQGPPFELTLSSSAGSSTQRHRVIGYSESPVLIDLKPRPADLHFAKLCLRNTGPGPVMLAGNLGSDNPEAPPSSNTPYERRTDEVRVDYLEDGKMSVFSMLSKVAERFVLFKAFGGLGRWALGLVIGLLVMTAIGAASIVLRSARQ